MINCAAFEALLCTAVEKAKRQVFGSFDESSVRLPNELRYLPDAAQTVVTIVTINGDRVAFMFLSKWTWQYCDDTIV